MSQIPTHTHSPAFRGRIISSALRKVRRAFKKAWAHGKTLEIWTKEVDEEDSRAQAHDLDDESSFLSSMDGDEVETVEVNGLHEVHVGKVSDEKAIRREG